MPEDPRPRSWPALVAALSALAIVTAVGLAIVAHPGWSAAELDAVAAVHGASNSFFDVIALGINAGLGPNGAPFIVLLVLAWTLLLTHSWRRTLRVGIVIGIPWTIAELLKDVVQRPRPDASQLAPMIVGDPTTYSYPSGHTAFAAALSCAVVLVLTMGRVRTISIVAGSVLVLLTAWSRVYLGVHYPTDVTASIDLVPFLAIATSRLTRPWLEPDTASPASVVTAETER